MILASQLSMICWQWYYSKKNVVLIRTLRCSANNSGQNTGSSISSISKTNTLSSDEIVSGIDELDISKIDFSDHVRRTLIDKISPLSPFESDRLEIFEFFVFKLDRKLKRQAKISESKPGKLRKFADKCCLYTGRVFLGWFMIMSIAVILELQMSK